MLSAIGSRSCGRKPLLIWSLLAPSTYKYTSPSKILGQTLAFSSLSPGGHVRKPPDETRRRPALVRARHVASRPPAPRRPTTPAPGPRKRTPRPRLPRARRAARWSGGDVGSRAADESGGATWQQREENRHVRRRGICPAREEREGSRVCPRISGSALFIEVEGARKLPMECGFRPRDRDRTL